MFTHTLCPVVAVFCSTSLKVNVAINFRGAVFCNSQRLEDRSSVNNHKCQQHDITEQENKTSAIKNNVTEI